MSERESLLPLGFELAFLRPTEYLYFEQQPNAKHKTSIWKVVSRSGGDTLGVIRWHGRWRQYCFFPSDGTLFNTDCLVSIADRIETCNRWQRNIRANLKAMTAT